MDRFFLPVQEFGYKETRNYTVVYCTAPGIQWDSCYRIQEIITTNRALQVAHTHTRSEMQTQAHRYTHRQTITHIQVPAHHCTQLQLHIHLRDYCLCTEQYR